MSFEIVKQIHESVLKELAGLPDEWAKKHIRDKRQAEAQDLYNRALLRRIFGDRRPERNAPDQGTT